MAAFTDTFTQLKGSIGRRFNWQNFLVDNITGSWLQTVWILFIVGVTIAYTLSRISAAPTSSIILVVAWAVGVVLVIVGEFFGRHFGVSRWLKENLFSSLSNTVLSLFLIMFIYMAASGIWSWAFANATFSPDLTAFEMRPENGATWGVIIGADKLLATGRLEPEHSWRVWLTLGMIILFWALTFITGREAVKARLKPLRTVSNVLWLLSPVFFYIFLAGIPDPDPFINLQTLLIGEGIVLGLWALLWWQKVIKFSPVSFAGWALAWPIAYITWQAIGSTGVFAPINVDNWGGFLLTMIFAIFVNVVSFPVGLFLALGRRSDVQGIPGWLVWPLAIGVTLYLLATQTPELLELSESIGGTLFAFWPLIIVVAAYLFMRMFNGSVVAASSTLFIEIVRGVPLITLLFMSIVMAKFFFADVNLLKNVYAALIGFTMFSAAYMAETIRGGLQAIVKGQFEAADALGFNTLQKYRFIVLPQAIRIVIPALVGQFIGTYKTSSLVAIVGLFDLFGITRTILANPQWLGLRQELYVFIAVVYFVGSAIMSWYSRRLEVRLGVGER